MEILLMKKLMFITLMICYLFAGCRNGKTAAKITELISATAGTEQAAAESKIISASIKTKSTASMISIWWAYWISWYRSWSSTS